MDRQEVKRNKEMVKFLLRLGRLAQKHGCTEAAKKLGTYRQRAVYARAFAEFIDFIKDKDKSLWLALFQGKVGGIIVAILEAGYSDKERLWKELKKRQGKSKEEKIREGVVKAFKRLGLYWYGKEEEV